MSSARANLVRTRAWRAANPVRNSDNRRRWRKANPEYDRTYTRDWRAAHAAIVRMQRRRYRAAHPETRQRNDALRRARIAQVLATLTAQEWEAILEAAGRACIYCGATKQITQDHLTPISRGGDHTAENVAPACGPCNSSKGDKTVAEFLVAV